MASTFAASSEISRAIAALFGERHGRSISGVTADGFNAILGTANSGAAMPFVHSAMAFGAVDLLVRHPTRSHVALGIGLGLGALWIAGQSPFATRRYER